MSDPSSTNAVCRGSGHNACLSTPLPRFDLLKIQDYLSVNVQFSRGCPFNCEFCDVIELYGRTPRTKTPAQFCRELEALLGFDGESQS